MKGTPFTQQHTALSARMAAFAGFNMPISYTGINDEHQAVREHAGLFDVSHMGEFILKGPQALALIQDLTSNDAAKLTNGKVQYSCMPNDEGGIIDDLLVYCLEENKAYMLVVNAGNIEKDWNWISANNHYGVDMQDISERTALLAVQGPQATSLLQPLTDMDLINLPYYTFVKGTFAGVDNVLISATGYTGAGGVEIYFDADPEKATHIWNAIMQAGAAYGLKPAGLGARDTLRLEMGFCLYGNDIDDHTSPIEAGLGWITKFTKPFKSRDVFEQQKANGTDRKLVGFEMIDRGIARHDHIITDIAGEPVGNVTSGTQSPTLSKAIGMGYVRTDLAVPGQIICIRIREQLVKARIVKTPFI